MADIKLTTQQQQAVDNTGGALLVSAAAGSGKTKVLTERLFRMMREGANVDEFLIITYTKAAAAELRSKIARELSRLVAEEPYEVHMRRQMLRIYQADIRTVDAFCAALLRENIHLLPPIENYSFTPDFRVLDEQEAALLKQRVLERTLEIFYQRMDEKDTLLAETLGAGRDDTALEKLVLELHTKVQSHPRPSAWLRKVAGEWEQIPDSLEQTVLGTQMMASVQQKTAFWAQQLQEQAVRLEDDPKLYAAYADRYIEAAESLKKFENARSWAEMAAIRVEFRTVGRAPDSPEKARTRLFWDKCKKSVKELLSLFEVTEAEYLQDLVHMAPAMLALLRLTEDFTQGYQIEKARRNAMDFSDQEHYAIDILLTPDGEKTDLARRMAQRYREIMVDEYQDTNEVQNCIFDAISLDGRNLFTVGDVKQSIYRFRLADPTIFLKKYHAFRDADEAAEDEPRRVVLSQNFRSRRQILDIANFVFENIMSEEMGELTYGEEERLNFGAAYYLPREDAAAEYHFLDIQDTEDEQFDRTAAEASFVAERIRNMLREGYPIQDGDTLRPCRPEDIVILMRSPRARLSAFTEALTAAGVPCSGGEGGNLFETVEVGVMYSFLQIIDNPRQDVPLIAVLRSPLFGFTADMLADIRSKCRTGEFYDALCASETEQAQQFLHLLSELRQTAAEMSADTLLWHIYDTVHAHAVFGAMPGGTERQQNLTLFYGYIQQLVNQGRRSVFEVTEYLRGLLERGNVPPIGQSESGGVRIMTIHKSKGLEFPVVFLCDLHKSFSRQDLDKAVLVHAQLGLGTECVDRRRKIHYPTIGKTAIAQALMKEGRAEEMRLLYVAMTRAKEKLIMVDCRKKGAKHLSELAALTACPVSPQVVEEAKCLGDWLLLPLLCTPEASSLRAWLEMGAGEMIPYAGELQFYLHHNPTACRTDADKQVVAPQVEELAFDADILRWKYAHLRAAQTASKVTATQLKGRIMDEEVAEGAAPAYHQRAFGKPHFMQEVQGLSGAEKGTATHLVMQYLDLTTDPTIEAVDEQIGKLRQKHLLMAEQAASVDRNAVTVFLGSALCQRICKAEKVYREYRFNLLVNAAVLDAALSDEQVMLQGVVDCAFVEGGELVIVDFKTDRIREAEVSARAEYYRPQLEAYAEAMGRVLQIPVKEKVLYFFHRKSTINL